MPPTEKAYKNLKFLNSPAARHIRLLCEYEEPRNRFSEQGVRDTIVMFGSARVRDPVHAAAEVDRSRRALDAATNDDERARAQAELAQAERKQRLSR